MKKKIILENGVDVWDAKKRYKVNQCVLFDGLSYQNVTGANSSPDALVDWVLVDINDSFIKSNDDLSLAKRNGDILHGILDQYTGEEITLSKTTDLNTADDIIYFDFGLEKFKRNFTSLNPFWFGCKSDGTTDDTINLRKFFYFAKDNDISKVFLLKGKSYYKVSGTIDLYVSINSDKASIQFSNQTCFSIKRDGVSIQNIESTATLTGTGSAPIFVYSENFNDIRIDFCKIINSRTQILNNSDVVMKNFYFTNNYFNVDFSGTEHLVAQNDFLSIRGIDGIYIENNYGVILNVHRGFKIQGSTFSNSSDYRSRNVFITKNNITASTDSSKQLFDFSNSTSNVLIDGNVIKASGTFSSIIEQKTSNEVTYDDSIKITNNFFSHVKQIIDLQGNYGCTTVDFLSGSKSCLISGNTFDVTYSSAVTECCGVKFYKNANIVNNVFTNEDKAFKTTKYLYIASNETVIVNGNQFKNGVSYLARLTTNSSGQTFNATIKSITFNANVWEDFGGIGGAIECQAMTQGEIIISNNFVNQLHDDGIANAIIKVSSQTLTSITATGNTASGFITIPIYLISSTVGEVVQCGNNWNQGTTAQRPGVANTPYYDTSLKKYIHFDGTNWVDGDTVVNATTLELSLATLNATYVNVLPGFEVHCISIIIEGPTIYKKTATGWVKLRVILAT